MTLENEIVVFNSNDENFQAEKYGYKPNTTREIDMSDERFKLLFLMKQSKDLGYVKIVHNITMGVAFVRKIQHICFYKSLVIISWIHEGEIGLDTQNVPIDKESEKHE